MDMGYYDFHDNKNALVVNIGGKTFFSFWLWKMKGKSHSFKWKMIHIIQTQKEKKFLYISVQFFFDIFVHVFGFPKPYQPKLISIGIYRKMFFFIIQCRKSYRWPVPPGAYHNGPNNGPVLTMYFLFWRCTYCPWTGDTFFSYLPVVSSMTFQHPVFKLNVNPKHAKC